MKFIRLILAAGLFATGLTAQAPPVSTTLARSLSLTDTQIILTSVTGLSTGSLVFTDHEAMTAIGVNGVIVQVLRGINGTSITPHTAGSPVYYGPGDSFLTRDLAGPCSADPSGVYVNIRNAATYGCNNGAWSQLNGGGAMAIVGTAAGTVAAGNDTRIVTAYQHVSDTTNPHQVTKAQVGLGNVPNVDATNAANITGTLAPAQLPQNYASYLPGGSTAAILCWNPTAGKFGYWLNSACDLSQTTGGGGGGGGTTPAITTSITPASQTLVQGQTTTYTVTYAAANLIAAISPSITGLPTGVTAAFSPTSVASTGGSTTLTLTADVNAPVATATLTVNGASSSTNGTAATASVTTAYPPTFLRSQLTANPTGPLAIPTSWADWKTLGDPVDTKSTGTHFVTNTACYPSGALYNDGSYTPANAISWTNGTNAASGSTTKGGYTGGGCTALLFQNSGNDIPVSAGIHHFGYLYEDYNSSNPGSMDFHVEISDQSNPGTITQQLVGSDTATNVSEGAGALRDMRFSLKVVNPSTIHTYLTMTGGFNYLIRGVYQID